MFCIECYVTNNEFKDAMFTVNGQSVCEPHVRDACKNPSGYTRVPVALRQPGDR
ncbi:hypothetical protein SEA_AEGEUS_143 [Mycobacterium phage Aegeus]|nr:hypothetical protein SEA_BAUDELAIRE_143 [Mycobacterium phage Baudelaire]WKW86617.1 hypothetical protein SEA_AEGEUS_143 [Mycobacterium phage Aegeus]